MNFEFRAQLMAATAVFAGAFGGAGAAGAQDPAPAAASQGAATSAVPAPKSSTAAGVSNPEEVRVANPEEIRIVGTRSLGGGLMKSQRAPAAVSSITPEAIAQKMPASSPLMLTSTIPGVNYGGSDPYGLAIRAYLSLRGLDQSEIGFLVEGTPAIEAVSYNPYLETNVDNENISDITIMAGNSRLQDPIINATGGEFIISTRNPSDQFGGRVSGTVGAFAGRRAFARIDTGEIAHSGLSAYLSGSMTGGDTYIGPGRSTRDHVDFKMRKQWAGGSESTLFASYTDWKNARIPLITLATFNAAKASGNFGNIPYLGSYPATGSTSYYKSYVYHRKTLLISNVNTIDLSDALKLTISPYYRYANVTSPGGTRIDPNSAYNGSRKVTPVFDPSYLIGGFLYATNNQITVQNQYGINSVLEYDVGDTNHLMLGYWTERYTADNTAFINLLDGSGRVKGVGRSFALRDAAGTLISGFDYRFKMTTHQFFVGDTQSFLDNRLQVSAGAKYIIYDVDGTNRLPGNQSVFGTHITKLQPRASFSFDANDQVQLYGNVVKNVRMPLTPSTYITAYNVGTGNPSIAAQPGARPETSVSTQLGSRYKGPFNLDLNVFRTSLKNHQVQSVQPLNGTNVTTILSAGDGILKGASAEFSSRRYGGFSVYANGQYLETTTKNNIASRGDFLPTAGKDIPLSPKWIYNLGLSYDRAVLFGTVGYKHISSQYSTFMNDQKLKGYSTLDASVGLRLPSVGGLKNTILAANFNNLTKGKYLSSVLGVQGNAVAVKGVNGTLLAGSNPSYTLAAPFTWSISLSTNF